MQIGPNFNLNLLSTLGLPTGTTTNGTQSSGQSIFGPAANLSLGNTSSTQANGTYSNLRSISIPQFNLAAVYGAQTQGVPQTARSEEQVKWEEAVIKKSLELVNAGELEDARSLVNQVLAENKTNAEAIHILGLAYQTEGKYEQAEQMYLRAHAIKPETGYDNDAQNARILQKDDDEVYNRAQTMMKAPSQRQEGIRLMMALTARNDDYTAAHVALGEAFLDEGDPLNGLMEYNTAIRVAEFSQLGGIERNLAALVDSAPNAPFPRQLLGKVYLRQERWDEALQTLSLARQLGDNATAYDRDVAKAHLGVGYERLDRHDVSGALRAFENAKELSPTDPAVKEALAEAYIARAREHVQRGSFDDALDDYDRAADLVEDQPGTQELREKAASAVYSLGLRLERRREDPDVISDDEVRAFKIAHAFDKENNTHKRRLAEARIEMGAVYEAEGDYEAAAHSYRNAHKLYEQNREYRDLAINAFITWGDEAAAGLEYDNAVEAYRQAYQLNTHNHTAKSKLAEAYNTRGLYHYEFEDYTLAVDDFEEALNLFPDNEEYQDNYNMVRHYDEDGEP